MTVKPPKRRNNALRNRIVGRNGYGLNGEDLQNGVELPWYCNTNNATSPHLYSTFVRNSPSNRRPSSTKKSIVYRDIRDGKPNNLNSLFAESSVPGLREICHSSNIFRKICWLFAFVILGILALNDIHLLLSEFYSYPITVDVRLRESRKLPFPAITVCNLNIVRFSALCNSTLNFSMPNELQEKLCGVQATAQNPKGNSSIDDINDIDVKVTSEVGITEPSEEPSTTTDAPSTVSSKPHRRSKRQSGKVTKNYPKASGLPPGSKHIPPGTHSGKPPVPSHEAPISEEVELTEREEKELQENLTTWLAVMVNKDKHLAYQLGHQFDDMVLRCTIKSTNCTHPRSFVPSFTPTEGNCFTYKSKTIGMRRGSSSKQEETSLAGVDHGLELVLNLEVNEYLPGTAQIGALVMVHSPDDFGTYASEAIFVAPERATYIGLKMLNITRLPSPYPEHCSDHWPENLIGTLAQNSTYSQQACLKICLQKTIQHRCSCQSAFLALVEMNNTDLRICDTRRKNTRKCVEEVMFRPENKIDGCDCPPRCQVTQYEKTVSIAKWPTREDRVMFDRGTKSVNFQNVAKVVVYFQTMTLQEVAQQGAWTTAKLFSSLGGFMGMYVGFSFLSLFEVFEVVSRRVWYTWTRKKPGFKTIAKTIAITTRHQRKAETPVGD